MEEQMRTRLDFAPHLAFAECVSAFAVPFLYAAILIALGVAGMMLLPQIGLAFMTVSCVGLLVFRLTFNAFVCGRQVLMMLYEEWKKDQIAERELAPQRLALEVNMRIGKGGQGTVNLGPQMQTTMNALVIESPDARAFIIHLQEFVQRANLMKQIGDGEGIERRHWLKSDGASLDYQFSDGTAVSRPEYEMLVEALRTSGNLVGRRQGTAGKQLT